MSRPRATIDPVRIPSDPRYTEHEVRGKRKKNKDRRQQPEKRKKTEEIQNMQLHLQKQELCIKELHQEVNVLKTDIRLLKEIVLRNNYTLPNTGYPPPILLYPNDANYGNNAPVVDSFRQF